MKRPSHRLRPKRYPSTPAVDETARGGHASTAETAFAHHATEPPSTTFADVDGRRDTMHLRVARARVLLAEGGRPIDVAHACGFCDQSHLNRWFRKTVGVTPRSYAASFGAGGSTF